MYDQHMQEQFNPKFGEQPDRVPSGAENYDMAVLKRTFLNDLEKMKALGEMRVSTDENSCTSVHDVAT